MRDKPRHVQAEYGAQFPDASVVAVYRHRPPPPDAVLTVLLEIIHDEPRAVLDRGGRQGELARPLAAQVSRVDAVDGSAGMGARGPRLAGGDRANLSWVAGKAEEAPLHPPYALVTAGNSLQPRDR